MSASFLGKARLEPAGEVLRLELECTLAQVREAAGRVRQFLAEDGVSPEAAWACELALVEACNNAVQHRSGCDCSPVVVEVRRAAAHIDIQIEDANEQFHFPSELELPSPDAENGRGLYLIRAVMDEVAYQRLNSANRLILRKNRSGAELTEKYRSSPG